jgi:hypothetical protein
MKLVLATHLGTAGLLRQAAGRPAVSALNWRRNLPPHGRRAHLSLGSRG